MLLESLLSVVDLEELQVQARYRIIDGFHRATEPDPRRRVFTKGTARRRGAVRGTFNEIVDCADGKVSTLAHDIMHRTGIKRRRLITASVFSNEDQAYFARKGRDYLELVLADLNHKLFSDVICEMIEDEEITYMIGSGRWRISQSAIDEHTRGKREARQARRAQRSKDDSRPFHGRPRRDRNNGTIPGVSIGGTKQGRRQVA